VVSACADASDVARAQGVAVLEESESGGLNAAATLGARHAAAGGAASVLILPCDLPLLDALALDALAHDCQRADVTIAPDESGAGTNALVVPAAPPFEFGFGEASFERHTRAAAERGLTVAVHRSPGFAFDVDTPEDYARWRAIRGENAERPMV
jgi:2-phospho-L-lactate guanylyltransferase